MTVAKSGLQTVVLTLFPQMFEGVLRESMWKRAVEQGLLHLRFVNFRDFAADKHHTVDDAPFGGGAGMVLKPEPLFRAVESLRTAEPAADTGPQIGANPVLDRVILLTPQGRLFSQDVARELVSSGERLVFVCGHYEGFDERVRSQLATDELSLGDFVMTGGEIAAMAIIDTLIRLIPGVLGNLTSAKDDSFSSGRLEYPQYTRPAVFRGSPVPAILLSGDHQKIAAWRRQQALYRTWLRRPELLEKQPPSTEEQEWLDKWKSGDLGD